MTAISQFGLPAVDRENFNQVDKILFAKNFSGGGSVEGWGLGGGEQGLEQPFLNCQLCRVACKTAKIIYSTVQNLAQTSNLWMALRIFMTTNTNLAV